VDLWVLLEAVSAPETKSPLSLADIWSFQLIVNAFFSGIEAGKAAELKKRNFLRGESACSHS